MSISSSSSADVTRFGATGLLGGTSLGLPLGEVSFAAGRVADAGLEPDLLLAVPQSGQTPLELSGSPHELQSGTGSLESSISGAPKTDDDRTCGFFPASAFAEAGLSAAVLVDTEVGFAGTFGRTGETGLVFDAELAVTGFAGAGGTGF